MRKLFLFIISSILLSILIGCSTNKPNDQADGHSGSTKEPGMEGYVVNKTEGRILVVASKPEDFSSTGGLPEFYNAIWFSNVDEPIEIGEKIQVWYDMVAESYPGQAEATKIAIIETEKPAESDLSEAETIRRALTSAEISPKDLAVIRSTSYNAANDHWIVEFKQGETIIPIQVVDSK